MANGKIELAEGDQHFNAFITPFGRFKHCTGLMSFAVTRGALSLRGDLALLSLENWWSFGESYGHLHHSG